MPRETSGEFKVIGAQSLGLAIKEYRAIEGVTQVELTKKSGLLRSYIAELEIGSSSIAVKYLVGAGPKTRVRWSQDSATNGPENRNSHPSIS